MVYLQKLKFSPTHLLELALEVFSLTYPDKWSLTPYKCKHQTEKNNGGKIISCTNAPRSSTAQD